MLWQEDNPHHLVFAVWEDGELVMDGSMIAENKILQVLGFTLDSKGTWLAHVDSIVKEGSSTKTGLIVVLIVE